MPPHPSKDGGGRSSSAWPALHLVSSSSKDLLGSHGHRAIDLYTNYTHCEGRGVRRMGEKV